ncbi:MAG TPA: Mut7-C RNAse domain-containing protein [Thermoplasmata archaeon]|nr:Mut7-C RNAse domain-containing protein [Thermoplasmata archaeon]
MKLLCDHMLGSLARWLRFMGYDTAYPEPGPDRTLIERARAEDRILLTRDKELAGRVPGTVAVRSDVLEEQIREVASSLSLRLVDPLSRCSLCNERLVQVPIEEVDGLVPEGVRSRHREFWKCPACRRVYWQGSHWDKMVERLDHLDLPRAEGP